MVWCPRPRPDRLDFRAMPTFRAPRGTRDLLPAETRDLDAPRAAGRRPRRALRLPARSRRRCSSRPTVFERGVGEVTDIVEKELFRIAPRTEEAESWALRPEPTAGIVRAYVQHGMQTLAAAGEADDDRADVPLRPPAGRPLPPVLAVRRRGDRRPGPGRRRRDHRARHRGSTATPGSTASRSCSTRSATPACRPGLRRRADRLLPRPRRPTCRRLERDRLERNALRLLDSKDPAMAALNAGGAADHRPAVRRVRRALRRRSGRTSTRSASPYRLEPGLVRGLDYYTRTAFEFYVAGREGQQQALGGGRPLRRPRRAARRQADARASGSGSGSTGWSSRSSEQGARDRPPSPARSPSSSAPTRTTPSAGCGSRRSCGRRASRARAELGRRKLGKQLEAAAKEQRPLRGHPRRRAGATARSSCATCQAGTQRLVALADLARELARAHAAHRHGPAETDARPS